MDGDPRAVKPFCYSSRFEQLNVLLLDEMFAQYGALCHLKLASCQRTLKFH
jgi:hypothetical protein